MELYFSPLACSMSARIALYEAGVDATFTYVETRTKTLGDGSDFLGINGMGQVPVLRTDNGDLIAENPVVLQYIADAYPGSGLAPHGGLERVRLQQWLNFITSELHKLVFISLLDAKAPQGAKDYARAKAGPILDYLNAQLQGREFLLDRFTVADAYLVTVLNWAAPCGIDLAQWPNIQAYHAGLRARPSVARAMAEEFALYQEQDKRRKAA
ncbi:MAG: glutathione S-transferase N-terminal domain-containing protein [Alphaproteobacteria bacterium]|nr:glutathione S-transferase N-terminal domain-containing protein [Alphaproteobacteria bacterium]OJU57545.1 MAG: glutathione S-transferase [Alphaproteobacteria bacterium 62-8]